MDPRPTVPPLSPSHEIADHVSEVRLRVRASSLGGLLVEAGRAIAELQLRGAEASSAGWRTIELSAPDRALLLVDWLNELIYLAEAERWVGVHFDVDSAEDGQLRARVRGVRLEHSVSLLKAATLHELRVAEIPGGLEGEVILDV